VHVGENTKIIFKNSRDAHKNGLDQDCKLVLVVVVKFQYAISMLEIRKVM